MCLNLCVILEIKITWQHASAQYITSGKWISIPSQVRWNVIVLTIFSPSLYLNRNRLLFVSKLLGRSWWISHVPYVMRRTSSVCKYVTNRSEHLYLLSHMFSYRKLYGFAYSLKIHTLDLQTYLIYTFLNISNQYSTLRALDPHFLFKLGVVWSYRQYSSRVGTEKSSVCFLVGERLINDNDKYLLQTKIQYNNDNKR